MALEDRIEKLTVVIEKWIAMVSLNRQPSEDTTATGQEGGPLLDQVVSEKSAATLSEPDAPVRRRRGRPPAEPVAQEPAPVAGEYSPDEEAQETAEPEPVSEKSPALEPVTEQEARDAMLKLHAAYGKAPAKAILAAHGLALLAEIQGKPDLWRPIRDEALAEIARLADDVI